MRLNESLALPELVNSHNLGTAEAETLEAHFPKNFLALVEEQFGLIKFLIDANKPAMTLDDDDSHPFGYAQLERSFLIKNDGFVLPPALYDITQSQYLLIHEALEKGLIGKQTRLDQIFKISKNGFKSTLTAILNGPHRGIIHHKVTHARALIWEALATGDIAEPTIHGNLVPVVQILGTDKKNHAAAHQRKLRILERDLDTVSILSRYSGLTYFFVYTKLSELIQECQTKIEYRELVKRAKELLENIESQQKAIVKIVKEKKLHNDAHQGNFFVEFIKKEYYQKQIPNGSETINSIPFNQECFSFNPLDYLLNPEEWVVVVRLSDFDKSFIPKDQPQLIDTMFDHYLKFLGRDLRLFVETGDLKTLQKLRHTCRSINSRLPTYFLATMSHCSENEAKKWLSFFEEVNGTVLKKLEPWKSNEAVLVSEVEYDLKCMNIIMEYNLAKANSQDLRALAWLDTYSNIPSPLRRTSTSESGRPRVGRF